MNFLIELHLFESPVLFAGQIQHREHWGISVEGCWIVLNLKICFKAL